MKKCISLFMLLIALVSLSSCEEEANAEIILNEFINAYGAEGAAYSSFSELGEEGYVPEGLFEKIYRYEGKLPENFAIYLNSHSHKGSECAVFVCKDEDERAGVVEMCLERMKLVCADKRNNVLIRSGNIVAYSTMEDADRAEELLRKIISRRS